MSYASSTRRALFLNRSLYFWIRIGFLVIQFSLSIAAVGTAHSVRQEAKAAGLADLASTMAWPLAAGSFTLIFSILSSVPIALPGAGLRTPAVIEMLWTLLSFSLLLGSFTVVEQDAQRSCGDGSNKLLRLPCQGSHVVARLLVFTGVLALIHHLSIYYRLWVHRHNDLIICTDMSDIVLSTTPHIPPISLPLERGQAHDIHGMPTKEWSHVSVFAGAQDEFTDVHLNALQLKIGPPTGFNTDARPEWARAMTVSRGRDAPFPTTALRDVAGLRPPAPVQTTSARRQSQSSAPSVGSAHARPANPTPTRATFVEYPQTATTVRSADSLWTDGASLAPPMPPPKDVRHMPSADRSTAWSQASLTPSSEVPPPLPALNLGLIMPAPAWVPAEHITKTKPVVRTKESPAWRRHRLVDDGGFFQPWVKTNAA